MHCRSVFALLWVVIVGMNGCAPEAEPPAAISTPAANAVPSRVQLHAALDVRQRWLDQLQRLLEERQLALAFDLLGGGPCEMAGTTVSDVQLSFEECRWVFDRVAEGAQLGMRARSSQAAGDRREQGIAELRKQVEATRDSAAREALEEHLRALEAARSMQRPPTPSQQELALIELVQSMEHQLAEQDARLEALREELKAAIRDGE